MAKTMFLASTVMVSFSSYWGLNLPVSGSIVEVQRLSTMPFTFPASSTRTSLGPQEGKIFTFSSSASAISSGEAGMVSRLSRQNMDTLPAPMR